MAEAEGLKDSDFGQTPKPKLKVSNTIALMIAFQLANFVILLERLKIFTKSDIV